MTKLGWNCESVVREALATVIGKTNWNTKYCLVYFDFLKNPKKYLREIWVWLDESFFYGGEGERWAVVKDKEAHMEKKGAFTRFGIIDAAFRSWEVLDSAVRAAHRDYWERAARQDDIWFVRDYEEDDGTRKIYVLKSRKLGKTSFVWLAQK